LRRKVEDYPLGESGVELVDRKKLAKEGFQVRATPHRSHSAPKADCKLRQWLPRTPLEESLHHEYVAAADSRGSFAGSLLKPLTQFVFVRRIQPIINDKRLVNVEVVDELPGK
jgi:hypothetical protein